MRRLIGPPGDPAPPGSEIAFEDYLATLAFPTPQRRLPWVRSVFVSSIDGAATGGDGRSGSLSTPHDAELFLHQRQLADVILVGAGTARAEGYRPVRVQAGTAEARAARGQRPAPVLCIVSGRLDLDPSDPLFTDSAERVVVATHSGSDWGKVERLGEVADVVRTPGEAVDTANLLSVLAERGHRRVTLEGGPTLHATLLADGLLDELLLTVSPRLVGGVSTPRITAGPAPAQPQRMTCVDLVQDDDETAFFLWRRAEDPAEGAGSAPTTQ